MKFPERGNFISLFALGIFDSASIIHVIYIHKQTNKFLNKSPTNRATVCVPGRWGCIIVSVTHAHI